MDTNTGRFQFLRQLVEDGVTCMFGNPGTSEQSLLDALRDPEFRDFKYYLALAEGPAVAMGDAYARATQRPAVVQLHSYAGLANGLGMIKYAHRGYTPMVVIAGEAGLKYDAMDGQMAGDLVAMARPFVKSDHNGPCAWRVLDPGSVLRLLRRAMKTAATPPAGPVFLALPADVLDLPNTEPVVPTTRVWSAVAPDPDLIAEAARLMVRADRPLILMGDGIAAAGAQKELADVAELLGAGVRGVNHSEVNMPASHPLFGDPLGHMFGSGSTPVTSGADAVLIVGTTIMPEVFPDLQGVFAPTASVVHFDLNVTELAKNFPMTLAALADPKLALGMLAAEIRRTRSDDQRGAAEKRKAQLGAARDKLRDEALAADANLRGKVPLRASEFFEQLAKRLPPDAVIFDEALTHYPELCRYVPQEKPGTYFQTRAGMLGTGLPSTIGLKAAFPDKVVVGVAGDGGSISTIQALGTAARHKLGAKFVVCNNRSYRILKYNLRRYRQDLSLPTTDPYPDSFDLTSPELRFDLLAQGQGVDAVRVERSDQIEPAIARALSDDKPFLIDLVLDSAL